MTRARVSMRRVLLTSMFTTIKQSLMAKISAAAKTILPNDHENTTVEIRMDIYRNGPAAFRNEPNTALKRYIGMADKAVRTSHKMICLREGFSSWRKAAS